jgi:hypothetical protein
VSDFIITSYLQNIYAEVITRFLNVSVSQLRK